MNRAFYLLLVAVIIGIIGVVGLLSAWLSEPTIIGGIFPGVVVSCESAEIVNVTQDSRTETRTNPVCDVSLQVREAQSGEILCNRSKVTIYDSPRGDVTCSGIDTQPEGSELTVAATFYVHNSTDKIGEDTEQLRLPSDWNERY